MSVYVCHTIHGKKGTRIERESEFKTNVTQQKNMMDTGGERSRKGLGRETLGDADVHM